MALISKSSHIPLSGVRVHGILSSREASIKLVKIIKENHLKSLEMDQQAYTKLRDLLNKFDGNVQEQ